MDCPYCESLKSRVVNKRDVGQGQGVRRRRECLQCKRRFSTVEAVSHLDLQVRKKDGRVVQFDPEKIRRGMILAAEKRPLTLDEIDSMVTKVEQQIRSLKIGVVPTSKIGELVVGLLKEKDEVAYMRFASVYKDFNTLDSFSEELKRMNDVKLE